MRYKVVSIIFMVFFVVIANLLFLRYSLTETRAASIKPASRTLLQVPYQGSKIDLGVLVSHQNQGCVKHGHQLVFVVQTSSALGSARITSGTIQVEFEQPTHLDQIVVTGSDWSFHKQGQKYTATYMGEYPLLPGQELGIIVVSGDVDTYDGGKSDFSSLLKLKGNTSSYTTSFNNVLLCYEKHTDNNGGSHSGGGSNSGGGGSSGGGSSGGGNFPGLPGTGSDPNA